MRDLVNNLFCSIKNLGEILDKLKARDFNATSLSTSDCPTLYTTLYHNLIKDKLIGPFKRTCKRDKKALLTLHVRTFLLWKNLQNIMHDLFKMYRCADLFVGQIFIRFGTKLYRHVVGIPMGTYCVPLVADLFLICYKRDFMMYLSDDKQADIIGAFNTTSRCGLFP